MSFVFKSIAHIQLAAPKGSEDKAKRFFSDILGFREIAKPELLKKEVVFGLNSLTIKFILELKNHLLPPKRHIQLLR